MRTNIVLDDDLVAEAKRLTGATTKREVVELALRALIDQHTRRRLSDLRGKIRFADGYDHRAAREERG